MSQRLSHIGFASVHPTVQLGAYAEIVSRAMERLEADRIVPRIWGADHTVWKSEPTDLADRLGWLDLPRQMRNETAALDAFALEIRRAGYSHVVLLGMGGSSMGAEVLAQICGAASHARALLILDSTIPSCIRDVADAIDPARTFFLVASKSGSTIEPNVLYQYFHRLVARQVGVERAGSHFAAITDLGTPLEELARDRGFLRVFATSPNVGGRYSALSYFGLAPAALAGVDIGRIIERAEMMAQSCSADSPVSQNPGAWLGASIGALAKRGRDKLTLVASPSFAGFEPWIEQLIAESTGKNGRGIVPIIEEPIVQPKYYGSDRAFAYIRANSDDNDSLDKAMSDIRDAGHPVILIRLDDRHDLGAEFFRWEFATAVASSILGVYPFDQPSVNDSKERTIAMLAELEASGSPPDVRPFGSISELLRQARPCDYLAIMAYIHQTPAVDEALFHLRRSIVEAQGIATTLGYGPRLLHSTGQLHKGGADTGLFLQIVSPHEADIPVPCEKFSFGMLADAQAAGDFHALRRRGRRVARVDATSIPGLT